MVTKSLATHKVDDFEESLTIGEQVLSLLPYKQNNWWAVRINLDRTLFKRYLTFGDYSDLGKAIEHERELPTLSGVQINAIIGYGGDD